MAARFNSDLVDDVARRRIVVFVGAGVSKWAKPHGGGAFKDWVQFLNTAKDALEVGRIQKLVANLIKEKDFLLASELLRQHLADKWRELLTAELKQAADISRLHKAIVALDPRIIVTTNFDKLIEGARENFKIHRN